MGLHGPSESVLKKESFPFGVKRKENDMAESKRHILLPKKGFFTEALRELTPVVDSGGWGLAKRKGPPTPVAIKSIIAGGRDILVIHSVVPNGPKLVELDDLAAMEVDRHPDVRRLPVIKYARPLTRSIMTASYPVIAPEPMKLLGMKPSVGTEVKIRVEEVKQGTKVPVGGGLKVIAFYSAKTGEKKYTDDSGEVTLQVSGNTIERLCCERLWEWGAYRKDIPVHSPIPLELEPVSEDFTDCVRTYYPQSRFDPATGVTVGIIDTGVGPHDDLNVIGGRNTTGEPEDDYQDVGPHGTFVAGLIGSTGTRFPKLRGLAPGVRIRSYRVFGGIPGSRTSNYALVHAMFHAQSDQCDILNLSIEGEGGPNDEYLQGAITDARDNGMLVVVAAGNDSRDHVDYPAAYPGATAVSAMGCKGTFPKGAIVNMVVPRALAGTDPNEFIAAFSNIGAQISVTALGVGVLSTLPENSFGSCSGTSMAAPVVTGAAASLLSQRLDIFSMPRNRARSDAIEQLLLSNCITRGFVPEYEGRGMPDPGKV